MEEKIQNDNTSNEVVTPKKKSTVVEGGLVNCLRNERIVVRHIPKTGGMVSNPKHVLFGGMSENTKRTFVVPRLQSGTFVNVLTKAEKEYLEYIMGLESNALSVFNKINNYWDDSNTESVSKVTLTKQDNYLNLADPEDYIKYKILLANKDFIASSLVELQDKPKVTYQFVIIAEGEEAKSTKQNMSTTMMCYKEYGKVENNKEVLRVIIETIDGRPTAANTQIEFLQSKINDFIQADSKLFLKVISDKLLPAKVLIKKAIEAGLISKRAEFYYLRADNSPLCEMNEEPTLNIAAKYLSAPKQQELKFSLEAKLN